MSLPPAPYFADVAYGPATAAAHWMQTSDGVRVRVGHWPLEGARGTTLIFPGRTEYLEKYGQIAGQLAARGLASAAIDWRGQGLSDRLIADPMVGHVEHFNDYQKDVAAMVRYLRALDLPRPYFLLAHSMGGAIGLRALMEGLAVRAVSFTGPMWGIRIAQPLKPLAWTLSTLMPRFGQGHRLPPGRSPGNHVLVDGFEANLLTRDREQFNIMHEQLIKYPELALGGPSYIWLREALNETRHLAGRGSPNLACITYLGSNERVVDISAVQKRMSTWKNGQLEIVPDGEHEVLMEGAAVTAPLFDRIAALFLHESHG